MAEIGMTLYDVAKQLAINESPMDPIMFNEKIKEVIENMLSKKAWMLLCRERNDYTVFINTDNSCYKKLREELQPTLQNRGTVILIDKQENGAWEIWIRDNITNENFAYYLFDYSQAIIDCEVPW